MVNSYIAGGSAMTLGNANLVGESINAFFFIATLFLETSYRYTCTYAEWHIQGYSLHQLVTATDWKQAKCLIKMDWLINDNTSTPWNIMLF